MKYLLVIFLIFFLPSFSHSQDNILSLKDGKIIIESEQGVKSLDYDEKDKYVPYNLMKWDVESKTDKVQEALQIFKNKQKSPYSQRVWIINKENKESKFYIEYISKNKDDKLLFSNNEEFAFYLSLSDDGSSYLYGINLLTQKASVVTQADNFNVFSCPNKDNYLIVQRYDEQDEKNIYVFTVKENGFEEISYQGEIEDFEDKICY